MTVGDCGKDGCYRQLPPFSWPVFRLTAAAGSGKLFFGIIRLGEGQLTGGFTLPRYDYQCTSCDYRFELVQSFSEAGRGECPLCSGSGRRVFHAVPVIYKGSGFYTTDYGRPKAPAEKGEKETADNANGKAPAGGKDSADSSAKSDTPAPAAAESAA